MSDHRFVLLIGGPDAGKTNYLGRFWLALEGGGSLIRAALPRDQEYLERLSSSLLAGSFAPHTSMEVHVRSTIPIRTAPGLPEYHGELVVPDCSGEQWQRIYKTREWSAEWEDLVSSACGCLFFVRVDSSEVVAPLDWISCYRYLGSTENPMPAAAEQGTPTQVMLTDWLQYLHQAFVAKAGGRFRPRIAAVITAWDRVAADMQDRSPSEYLNSTFPMFQQFLETNGEIFDIQVFGVSVVGGDLIADNSFREEYLRDPQNFGYVLYRRADGTVARSADLTLPVAWGIGLPIPEV